MGHQGPGPSQAHLPPRVKYDDAGSHGAAGHRCAGRALSLQIQCLLAVVRCSRGGGASRSSLQFNRVQSRDAEATTLDGGNPVGGRASPGFCCWLGPMF